MQLAGSATGYAGVNELVRRLAEAMSVERVGITLAESLPRVLDASRVLVAAPHEAGWRIVCSTPDPSAALPPLAERAVATRGLARGEVDGERAIAAPLLLRNRVRGVLVLVPRAGEPDAEVLDAMALQCALALDRAVIHEDETQQRLELEESESRFRTLVHELDAVFWECDPKTFQFSFISQRAEAMLGYPTARWLEPGFWASVVHPEDRHWAVSFCVECTQEGRDHAFEYRLVAADGRVRWFRDVVYVMRDAEGRATKLRGVMVDITHERKDDRRVARRIPSTFRPQAQRPSAAYP